MRITQAVAQRLSDYILAQAGLVTLQGINHNGNSRGTAYCMAESATSVYYGAREAAAYLLGVLTGLDPEGQIHWVETRPEWITEIDSAFKFGSMSPAAVRAFHAGYEHGRTHRLADRLERIRASLRRENISYGELHELQGLAALIDPGDTELLEAAGVPEHGDPDDASPRSGLNRHSIHLLSERWRS